MATYTGDTRCDADICGQIYNSTVTQMSACLLSLSVISLVLPVGVLAIFPCPSHSLTRPLPQTAFHASFADNKLADSESLKISRGTSVVGHIPFVTPESPMRHSTE